MARGVDGSRETAARLESARELDRQGVRAFREGHFADAVRYFRAAYEHGGPSSELWNVARCEEHLDDPAASVAALEEYTALSDLSAADRADARHEADALQLRPSMVTVTTRPPGATVWIDAARAPGVTPLSVLVPPGAHTLQVRRTGASAISESFEGHLGRAVIVSLDLRPGDK
jgi:hypothetical protein